MWHGHETFKFNGTLTKPKQHIMELPSTNETSQGGFLDQLSTY